MPNSSLANRTTQRLDEAPRGDHGWWLITRVHLTTARLRNIATYLLDIGAADGRELRERDYRALGNLVGVGGDNPGQTLRRHHLLAMETPLRLLERVDGRRWDEIQLTSLGVRLALDPNAAVILEQALQAIVFCAEPYFTRSRVAEYPDFNIRPYPITLYVLEACDGWIDRDEYDLFVSRVREDGEVDSAIAGIKEFRTLEATKRRSLLKEVRVRIPPDMPKVYQNWRDMGLHTFSLFALGTSAIRLEQRLVLSRKYLTTQPAPSLSRADAERAPRIRTRAVRERQNLRIPEPPASDELAVPPTSPASNTGTDAEILVGKLLTTSGWDVVYYSARRGYGFDIWARKGIAALVIEVKSSVGTLGAIYLTRLERDAAERYGKNFVIALVEGVATESPIVRFIVDPMHSLPIQTRTIETYMVSREDWERATHATDPHDLT